MSQQRPTFTLPFPPLFNSEASTMETWADLLERNLMLSSRYGNQSSLGSLKQIRISPAAV